MDNYRLGLDVGTNSLGWSVLKVDKEGVPYAIVDAGARIFSDGRDSKSKSTLAANRREARSARRRRDRFKQRQAFLLAVLTESGLFPEMTAEREALRTLNPLELRALALTKKLEPYHIGRALFHINQRRGFKSNRKDKSEESGSDGKISRSARLLLEKMGLIGPKKDGSLSKEEFNKLSKEEKSRAREAKKQADKVEYEALKKASEDLRNLKKLTYGSFLYGFHEDKKSTRVRPTGTNKDDLYLFYPIREMYEDEFEKIWYAQAKHHPALMMEKTRKRIRDVIFTQRPLKPQKRGHCTYMPDELRTFRAMPSFQRYRIYQDVNNLEWNNGEGKFKNASSRALWDARDAIIKLMERPVTQKGNVAWRTIENTIKKHKLAEGNIKFNFMRDEKRENGLDGNLTSNIMQHEYYVGDIWHGWDLDKQDEFVDIILNGTPEQQKRDNEAEKARKEGKGNKQHIIDGANDEEELANYLVENFNLQKHAAEKCVNAPLQDGTAHISLKAARYMLEKMRDGVEETDKETGEISTILPIQPDAAIVCANEIKEFNNPFRNKGDDGKYEICDKLPYYGKAFKDGRHIIPGDEDQKYLHDDLKFYGGVTNPTVHIALNQIRQVVNELIDRYGHPYSIAIELGRDLPVGAKGRSDISAEQKANQTKNELYNERLAKFDVELNRNNRLRLELWEKQDKRCPYTLEPIRCASLFTPDIEIDHILPYSRSLDDSTANKAVCKRKANRDKGNKTPWEAFYSHADYNWKAISENAVVRYYHKKDKQWKTGTPKKALWRFRENAFKIWEGDNEEVEKAAKEMVKNDNLAVQNIGKQILEKGVGSLSAKQKKIAEEHGIPNPDFSDRHLNDTRYIGRLTREYLENICDIDKINVLTGRLTSLLRRHWGLNSILWEGNYASNPGKKLIGAVQEYKAYASEEKKHKTVDATLSFVSSLSDKYRETEKALVSAARNYTENLSEYTEVALVNAASDYVAKRPKNRDDHRHHAIDAVVIGMTSKSILQKVATAANKAEVPGIEMLFLKDEQGHSAIDPDWTDENGQKINFRNAAKYIVCKIIVSHKARRKKEGQLHKKFTYGIANECIRARLNKSEKDESITADVVLRRDINAFISRKHVEEIRDKKLREEFLKAFDEAETISKKGVEGIKNFVDKKEHTDGSRIRHLRVQLQRTVHPIRDKKSRKVYKAFWLRNNWATEIFEYPQKNTKEAGQWVGKTISKYEANQSDFDPDNVKNRLPHPAARFIMRLYEDDFVEIEENGEKRIMRVQKMSGGGVYICEHQEANVADRLKELVDKNIAISASASRLQKLKARKVHINPTGQVNYEKQRKPRSQRNRE